MSKDRLLLATKNKDKITEIKDILSDLNFEIHSLNDFNFVFELKEEENTIKKNAIRKATAIATASGLPALADDSGLEVDFLNGAPGPFSARFAGKKATDKQNISKLLSLLKGVPMQERKARFKCVISLASPSGEFWITEGKCEGLILQKQKGKEGFGYDPIFFLPSFGKTFAQLGPEVKNRISHRAKALFKLKEILKQIPPQKLYGDLS